ncbi:membrane protein insertion efficiency factor YidD [Halonatronum saccharophilum]|uniref:membrane protein insertion efficiency factor YidD n=1 Tax=Halonatronum saccharophilum TaxID=150060 RepID=UPI0004B5AC14|nr:membrane protein insertion efficiency factor YidD [Halonatronum saccharophilum]
MSILSKIFIGFIRFYQKFISPLKPFRSCRFYPTCSSYAIKALKRYGLLKGGIKAIKRILRCHPLNKGGYDPLD